MSDQKTLGLCCKNCKTQTVAEIVVNWWQSSQELKLKIQNSNFSFQKSYHNEGVDIVCSKCNKVISSLKYSEILD